MERISSDSFTIITSFFDNKSHFMMTRVNRNIRKMVRDNDIYLYEPISDVQLSQSKLAEYANKIRLLNMVVGWSYDGLSQLLVDATNLKHLQIRLTQSTQIVITNENISHIDGVLPLKLHSSLDSLSINGISKKENTIEWHCKLPKLHTLSIEKCTVRNIYFDPPPLQTLILINCHLDKHWADTLFNIGTLKKFHSAATNIYFDVNEISSIIGESTNTIEDIKIDWLRYIHEDMPKLKYLEIVEDSLQYGLDLCPKLERYIVDGIEQEIKKI